MSSYEQTQGLKDEYTLQVIDQEVGYVTLDDGGYDEEAHLLLEEYEQIFLGQD